MSFLLVNWDEYNEPPYLPQWLCEGETLELAKYDDNLRIEIENELRSMVEQYDLDKVKGVLLDRIGKILAEPRNGNDDEIYRLYLKLRTMLNTTDGSVNDVIKVIKYLYSSEIVQIVPDYPAGLIILHDGEGPDINFNAIIRQVVGAGIDYSTKELFYHTDEFDLRETYSNMKSKREMTDYMAYIFRNGTYRRNGQITRRYNGVKDTIIINVTVKSIGDRSIGLAYRNGLFRRNGTIKHDGLVLDLNTELLPIKIKTGMTDNGELTEITPITIANTRAEWFEREFRRNGVYRRDGTKQRKANVIIENITHNAITTISEQQRGLAFRNGMYHRNGMIKRTFVNDTMTELLQIPINYDFSDFVTADDPITLSINKEDNEILHKEIIRNGKYRRNGTLLRSVGVVDISTGTIKSGFTEVTDELKETFTIGYREYRSRNGIYRRNGQIKRNANVFIPLE